MPWTMPRPAKVPAFLLILAIFLLPLDISAGRVRRVDRSVRRNDASVLILGGGVAGVIAARTLHERGIDNFLIIEARDELGGRMQNKTFGGPGNAHTIEQGPNWVQGTQTGNGPANPIFDLVKKHGVKTEFNDLFGSVCGFCRLFEHSITVLIFRAAAFYDFNGPIDASDHLEEQSDSFTELTIIAGNELPDRTLIFAFLI